MGVRFLVWLGAGAVCAGVTVGMLAGAATASAKTESDGDGAAKTSQSAKTTQSQPDSSKDQEPATADARPAFGRNAAKTITAVKHAVDDAVTKVVKAAGADDRVTATGATVATSARPKPGQRAAAFVNNVVAAVTHAPERKVVVERTRQSEPVEQRPSPVPPNVPPRSRNRRNFEWYGTFARRCRRPMRSNLTLQTPTVVQPTAAAAPQPQIDVPPVISAIGTAVFNLISFGESLIEGPPKALPGSGVTVERSTLTIGDQEVPADWYFPDTYAPESGTPPDRIIYLQHGFLARGVFYDYTASYLAKETNSVVVAPTLTSNIFATDGMWLGGDQMHRAVADLFKDDNPALLESAKAAGYGQDQLPQQVVLVGHSLGGGLVIDTARYMARDPETAGKLAGVVMLDGVAFTDPVPILDELNETAPQLPIYNLSSTPYPWNLFGTMDAALAQVRPNDFTGTQMFFGFHSDAMVGGNPLIQLGAYLITGYGGPANVAGTQILAAGWINDMFERRPGIRVLRRTGFDDQDSDTGGSRHRTCPAGAGRPDLTRSTRDGCLHRIARAHQLRHRRACADQRLAAHRAARCRRRQQRGADGGHGRSLRSDHPVRTPRVHDLGGLVLPDAGRRLGAARRRDLAAARIPWQKVLVFGAGDRSRTADQQRGGGPQRAVVPAAAVLGLHVEQRGAAGGNGHDVPRGAVGSERQRQLRQASRARCPSSSSWRGIPPVAASRPRSAATPSPTGPPQTTCSVS